MTALHMAGVHGHASVLRMLLRNGASININDDRGRTVYHAVAYSGDTECMDIISDAVKEQGAEIRKVTVRLKIEILVC